MNVLIQYRQVEQEVTQQEVTQTKQLTAATAEAEINVESLNKKRKPKTATTAGV
jgi:hypothetical protein